MLGFNGGLIGAPRSGGAISGVWLPPEQAIARLQNAWPVTNDPFANDTTLLLRFDGTVGTPALVNLGRNSATLSTVGSPQIVSDQQLFGGNTIRFGPSGKYVVAQLPGGLGSGDFTMEFWAYPLSPSNPGATFNSRSGGTGADGVDVFSDWSLGTSFQILISTAAVLGTSQWYHVAYVRNAGLFRRYINGVGVTGSSNNNNMNGQTLNIGGSPAGNVGWFDGYMGEFRLTRAARYIEDFAPPVGRFPAP